MTRRRWTTSAATAGLLVLAAVIVVGVWQSRQPGSIPAVRLAQSYPVRLSDGVVIAGAAAPGVPVVDIYEDPLCPACKALEDRIAPQLAPALTGGRITVRYHIINFLDPMSKPPGYPLTAANAMLCAAQDGVFSDYHASLYAAQPHEDSTGYTIDALVGLGAQLGAPPDFTACERGGRYEQTVRAQLQAFLTNPTMLTALPSGLPALGTPGVLIDGRRVDDPATTLPQLITH